MMLAAMIKQTGSTHPQALRAAFNGASQFPGITGELSFSPKKHVTITSGDLTLVRYDAASKKWVPLGAI
jgi:branched-chain amino acid transport system substrate-binding protein